MQICFCLPAPEFRDPTKTEVFPSGGPGPGTGQPCAPPLRSAAIASMPALPGRIRVELGLLGGRGSGDRNHRNKARLRGAPVGSAFVGTGLPSPGAGFHAELTGLGHQVCSGHPLCTPASGPESKRSLRLGPLLHRARGVENSEHPPAPRLIVS